MKHRRAVADQRCIECGDKFIGRQDKKFCTAHCRSVHNNRLNSDHNNFVRNVNNILRKNCRILKQLNPKGKTKVHRDDMLELGFNFKYFTNEYVTKGGKVYHFCYDQGYLLLDNNFYAIVERQAYVS